MLHHIADIAIQNMTELIDGVDFHLSVFAQTKQLSAAYIVVGVQAVFGPLFVKVCRILS